MCCFPRCWLICLDLGTRHPTTACSTAPKGSHPFLRGDWQRSFLKRRARGITRSTAVLCLHCCRQWQPSVYKKCPCQKNSSARRLRESVPSMKRRDVIAGFALAASGTAFQQPDAGSIYIPKAHRVEDRALLHDSMDEYAFVDLVTATPSIRITHIPVLLDRS